MGRDGIEPPTPAFSGWHSAALILLIRPNGDSASVTYDSNARPQTSTSPYGAQTTYTYNDSASPPNKIATTNGHWVKTSMDGFGRPIEADTGYSTTTVSTVQSVYAPCGCSPLGKLSQTTQPYAPGGTQYWTTYTYDASGRTTKVTLPDGSATTYLYQGNTVKVTDPAGKWKTYTMDAFGNLTSVLEPDPTLGNVTTTYTYDILSHLTGVSMPRGSNTQTRTFNYTTGTTVGGFLLSTTNPETGTVTYTYDSSNRLASKTDAKGQNFTYQYDNYNRLTSVTWHNAPGGAQVLRTFMYDSNSLDSHFSGSYTKGRLVAVQNQSFKPGNSTSPSAISLTEMYAYTQPGETSGKRLQVTETLSGGTPSSNLDTLYTYDNEGNMTSVAYPNSGPTYTYSFDSMHRPIGLTDQNNNPDVSGVSYNAANQLTGITYFGASETRQYNNLAQLTQLSVTGTASLSYTYNYPTGTNNGQIGSQVVSGETITYTYDSLKRLISAQSSASWGENYGYDAFGNLLSKTPTAGSPPSLSQAVNPANNQIVGQSYDTNGNQTSAPAGGSLTYDSENRLVTSSGVQYGYDSHNQRAWIGTLDENGNLTGQKAFLYGADGKMLGEYSITSGTNSLTIATVLLTNYFGGKRIGTTNPSGVSTALGSDRQDSVGQYYPYGEGKGGNNPADTWSYATYWRDSATGLDYANRRFFSNQFGRFMTPDPYAASGGPGDPRSWNRYSYTRGDPINSVDPIGLFDETDLLWPICMGPGEVDWCEFGTIFGQIIHGGGGSGGGSLGKPTIEMAENFIANALGLKLPGPGSNTMEVWALLIASGLLSNQQKATSATSAHQKYAYPTMLMVSADSCTQGSPLGDPWITPNAVRSLTYTVIDQNGNPWNGNDGPLSVNEVISNPQIVGQGVWTFGAQDGINSRGQFIDYLSYGTLFPAGQKVTTATQIFFGLGAFVPQALPIEGMSGDMWLSNNIQYAGNTVIINGHPAPGGCH